MKFNRILSLALVAVMLVASVSVLIPVRAEAAYTSEVVSKRLSLEEVQKIVDDFKNGQKAERDANGNIDYFDDAYERLEYDLSKGHLDKATNGKFTIYVNRYTGVMYYQNNETGEMLTSNPFNFPLEAGTSNELFSQVKIEYSTVADTETNKTMYSYVDAANRNQITVTPINGGLRVAYAMGNTATRELVPAAIDVDAFEDKILRPAMELLYAKLVDILGEESVDFYFDSEHYDKEEIRSNTLLHFYSISGYKRYVESLLNGVTSTDDEIKLKVIEAKRLNSDIENFFMSYSMYNPSTLTEDELKNAPDITAIKEGRSVYVHNATKLSILAKYAKILKRISPNYTFEMMYEDEESCGYKVERVFEPVFRLALEYTINDDGTLSVRLPSNSIVFDETRYILKSITPLQYFGSANFHRDGYVFIPDGSGAIIEFDDFENSNVAMSLNAYGQDYCYSQLTGSIYGQNVVMPVYGIVSQSYKGADLIDTGFFAIIEEGASTANINLNYTSATYFEGSVYSTFKPYPTDRFDLSDTISVGGNAFYSIVAESKYAGSYVTKYVMLSDNEKNGVYTENGVVNYNPDYIGMAQYYRNYLIKNGVISALQQSEVQDNLPLYIEALGSIEVVEKILTFPVNISRAITTFDNVVDMYEELGTAQADAQQRLNAKAAEYKAMADAETDVDLKNEYQKKADSYTELALKIVNINNVNFKLTGFANGGMYFTYPTKVKWERVLGGKRGFKDLLDTAKSYNDAGTNFGVYPDFDFQYISNTSMFDGIGKRDTVSKMVDNRYASKQAYSNITGEFDTIYSMLVSPDALDRLYSKFIKKYSKYNVSGISVSTLGSDLNSNFDEDNPISRDDSQRYVTELLDRIANENGYSVMMSKGNIYAAKYADHILEVATDSSYYRYSSYTVPFVGMMLHGYVNYTGSAFNYSGSPDYDLLRSIESGASLYYILGYQNTDLMKDDEKLNKYYSISYENWFDNIIETYAKLNAEIGDLQGYEIVGHEILIGERLIEADEIQANINALKTEFINEVEKAIHAAIDAAFDAMYEGNVTDTSIDLQVNVEALVALAHERFELDEDETLGEEFTAALNALVSEYKAEYENSALSQKYDVVIDDSHIDYESAYKYVTGSIATDGKAYETTDYTVDNDLIVRVTYRSGNLVREFILNYNIYAVEVTLPDRNNPGEVITYPIDRYGFVRADYQIQG